MCRYSVSAYKPHYACFACRKTFKRRLLVDIDRGAAYDEDREAVQAKCPDCGGLMANMGLDFESPKMKDEKAWGHIENLFESGITFHSCGCFGPGYIPKDKDKLKEYLEEKKDKYIEHRRHWSNPVEPQTKSEKNKQAEYFYGVPGEMKTGTRKKREVDAAKAVKYWTEKIEEVEERIRKIGSAS